MDYSVQTVSLKEAFDQLRDRQSREPKDLLSEKIDLFLLKRLQQQSEGDTKGGNPNPTLGQIASNAIKGVPPKKISTDSNSEIKGFSKNSNHDF